MRTKEEMFTLILHVANKDPRVRAVVLNGSRTNPNAPKDIFQDYDIVYLVNDLASFLEQPGWIDVFGDRIIMQTPEDMSLFPAELGGRYSYLMLFTDGNRIDLTLVPYDEKDDYIKEDRLTEVLLDKDRSLPLIPVSSDQDYWVKRPMEVHFLDCCNEFWWITTYIAKGLWREEILYALDHLHQNGRPMLVKMLEWQVGIETDFKVSVGKAGKYLEKYLTKETWRKLLVTYTDASPESVWQSLFTMIDIFRESSNFVADRLNFDYPVDWDEHVSAYLNMVKSLPKYATTFE